MYDKYTWQDGEVITAEKLNNMEDGIASAGNAIPVILLNEIPGMTTKYEFDKTYAELLAMTEEVGIRRMVRVIHSVNQSASTTQERLCEMEKSGDQVAITHNRFSLSGSNALYISSEKFHVATDNTVTHTINSKQIA